MDRPDEYAMARELAITGRYREARDSLKGLLQSDPAQVEAFILGGKVEYYLGHPAASRRSFEIALSYEPGNTAAFFPASPCGDRRGNRVSHASPDVVHEPDG
jgi:hypothetical protein